MRTVVAAAALIAALAVGACGGGTDTATPEREQYRKHAQLISDKFQLDYHSALGNVRSRNPRQSLQGVDDISSYASETADAYAGLTVPPEYRAAHDDLVGALRAVVDRAQAIDRAAKAGDTPASERAVGAFQASIDALGRQIEEFDRVVGTT